MKKSKVIFLTVLILTFTLLIIGIILQRFTTNYSLGGYFLLLGTVTLMMEIAYALTIANSKKCPKCGTIVMTHNKKNPVRSAKCDKCGYVFFLENLK